MAERHRSALKADRHGGRRRLINRRNKSHFKMVLKEIRTIIKDGKGKEARANLSEVQSVLDKMIQKGIIHKNTAARYKSRLSRKISTLAS